MTQYAATAAGGTIWVLLRKWESWVYLVWPRVWWGLLFPVTVTCHQSWTNGPVTRVTGQIRDKLHDLITTLSSVNCCNAPIWRGKVIKTFNYLGNNLHTVIVLKIDNDGWWKSFPITSYFEGISSSWFNIYINCSCQIPSGCFAIKTF